MTRGELIINYKLRGARTKCGGRRRAAGGGFHTSIRSASPDKRPAPVGRVRVAGRDSDPPRPRVLDADKTARDGRRDPTWGGTAAEAPDTLPHTPNTVLRHRYANTQSPTPQHATQRKL